MTVRIAMWSGPRNISTAMMRSWENRADCSVIDEPFYAAYLKRTQFRHPMFDEVLASQPNDYQTVIEDLTKALVETPLQYQKHMTHHILEHDDLAWAADMKHCFLIRNPAYVINSYTNSMGHCSVDDIGIIRQYEIYKRLSDNFSNPLPVIDTEKTLNNPMQTIKALCDALNIKFDSAMLSWPAGKRDSDGVWAAHWYRSVEQSTGFSKPQMRDVSLNAEQRAVLEEVLPFYESLKRFCL